MCCAARTDREGKEIFARSAASHLICKGVTDVPKSFSLQKFFGTTGSVMIVAKSAHKCAN
jgi:hypothetical protein